eukprot:TRINITY_DN17964_c1_g1_i1.p1 TRINITY_DN17964_c1_g1~~TRINITY_DN17964_c1_g1_i1.p1  ORF type:complete len:154 (-),score=34.78 TRINITY_DN17964_c1_g1_i1:396-857(-)
MAPNTAARNASPAPRVAKKTEDTKENHGQNAISDDVEKVQKKPQATQEELQEQSKLEASEGEGGSVLQGIRCRIASACCSIRTFGCSMSLRVKVTLFAFSMLLAACVFFQSTHAGGVNEFATKLQSVYKQVKSVTHQAFAGLASKPVQESADL